MIRIDVPPAMLRWACERAGRDVSEVAERVPQLRAWIRGQRQPTFKQLERLAKVTHTPFGYMFLFYETRVKRERKRGAKSTGGSFFNNQNARVGQFFATHVMRAAIEGRIGFKEAYDLTGLRGGTFQEYARRLGFDLP